MRTRSIIFTIGLELVLSVSLATQSYAIDEINLEELKAKYPPCLSGSQTWDNCFGSDVDSSTEAMQERKGLYRGNKLWTGNVYEFGQVSSVCSEGQCEHVASCEFSTFKMKYVCRNGDSFSGFTFDTEGNKQGKGIYEWANGGRYEGEMKNNVPDGYGVYLYAIGTLYRGYYRQGFENGKGFMKFTDGSYYDGEWSDGQRSGQGEYVFSYGSKYIGEFKNGEFNGQGTYHHADGTEQRGRWLNGEFIGN